MKLIRLVSPTSNVKKSEFINKFEDNVIIEPYSEIAMVNCTIPISLEDEVVVSDDNDQFTLTIDAVEIPINVGNGTYSTLEFLELLQQNIRLTVENVIPDEAKGMEWSVLLETGTKLKMVFDKVGDHEITNQTPHLIRAHGTNDAVLVFNPNNKSFTRDQAQGGDELDGWGYVNIPYTRAYGGTFDAGFGNSIGDISEVYPDWYIGLVTTANRPPSRFDDFDFTTDMKYGFYLSNEDQEAHIVADGVDYTVAIDNAVADRIIGGSVEISINTVPGTLSPYFVVKIKDQDGNNQIATDDPRYDAELEVWKVLLQTPLPNTLLPIFGLGIQNNAEIVNPEYTPTTAAIEEDGFARIPVDVILDLGSLGAQNLLGFSQNTYISNNYAGRGIFQADKPLYSNAFIPSIVVFLNNIKLDCYDGGQNGFGDGGKSRSIIGSIPSTYRDSYNIGYEPNNLLWIPINNSETLNMRELEYGFAQGNTFAPFPALDSVLTLAIRKGTMPRDMSEV